MRARVVLLAVASFLGMASTTVARQKEPLPRAVFDVRAASVGLPTVNGWTPPVPENTVVPSRGLGFDLGGHVFIWRGRVVALGVGAAAIMARRTASPPQAQAARATSPAPDVTTRLTTLVPQLSINFGHRYGWSYISGGIGRARVRSKVSQPLTITSPGALESGWVQSTNYGGGARWFINDHIAFNLDLRWHRLPSVAATASQPAAGKASLIVAGGGISIR